MKIKLNPFLKEARGRFDDLVFRLCHTGEWQITRRPDMSKVRWSKAQDDHRALWAEATAYARAALKYPHLREFYLQMAWERKRNKRPFDMAVSDYCHNRINRMGPDVHFWDPEEWRADVEARRRKRQRKPGWWGR